MALESSLASGFVYTSFILEVNSGFDLVKKLVWRAIKSANKLTGSAGGLGGSWLVTPEEVDGTGLTKS